MNFPRRTFDRNAPDFPTTPALQKSLERRSMIEAPAVPRLVANSNIAVEASPCPAGSILLGYASGKPVHIDVTGILAGRCLVQGSSNAGKSRTLRRMIEEMHHHVAVIMVDPEGEFGNLAEHIGATTVRAAETTNDGMTSIALKAREHRLHLHIDLSDLDPDMRIRQAAAFFAGLVAAPREHWQNTVLVAIDEAHLLAPQVAASARDRESRTLGVATLTDLASRGRKRGIGMILATQRLAKLSASVVSELHNFLLGLNSSEPDIKRVADLLGWTYDKAAVVRDLEPGNFYGLGPAIARLPVLVKVEGSQTQHLGATPDLLPAAVVPADEARGLLSLDQVREMRPIGAVRQAASKNTNGLDLFLLDEAAVHASAIFSRLKAIMPNAAVADDISNKLGIPINDVHAALDLLSVLGTIESSTRADAARIARVSHRLRAKVQDTPVVGLA